MLAHLDSFLLSKAQKLCDQFQRLTGLTKFQLEKWSLILAATSYWMFAIEVATTCIVLVALLESVISLMMVRDAEREERIFLARGELKPNINHIPKVRITNLAFYVGASALSMALMFIALVPELTWLLAWVTCVLTRIYLSACVPRPPGKSKMREWAENGVMWLRDSLPPAPLPIPVSVR